MGDKEDQRHHQDLPHNQCISETTSKRRKKYMTFQMHCLRLSRRDEIFSDINSNKKMQQLLIHACGQKKTETLCNVRLHSSWPPIIAKSVRYLGIAKYSYLIILDSEWCFFLAVPAPCSSSHAMVPKLSDAKTYDRNSAKPNSGSNATPPTCRR